MTELTTSPEQPRPDFLSRPLLAAYSLDWEKTIYLLFIIVAIVTRFWALGDRVMSHDESLHTQYSYQYYDGQGYSHTPLMHGPSLFHLTAISYWLFGDSDLSARIPVAIVGIILVAMPYLLRDWIGRTGALFTSFFLLISPYISYYSRYIRHDIYSAVCAFIVFIAIWYFIRQQKEKYLWWFVAALALLYATKEDSFIYTAIFGSFVVLRLLARLGVATWVRQTLPRLRPAILLAIVGVLLLGAGLVGLRLGGDEMTTPATTEATEGFAADPSAEQTATPEGEPPQSGMEIVLRLSQLAGVALLSAGLFLAARQMRPHLDAYPEFTIIILFATLVLPLASPLLTTMAGWNPEDYTLNTCILEGQETMSALRIFTARLTNSTCISAFFESGIVRSTIFVIITLVTAVLVGLWWDSRRWLIAAAIFYSIFFVLFTSVFTNLGGWQTGVIGSLGYWLEQQGVERGSQPWYYYLFVVPFYEFLPLLFSLLGMALWAKRQKLNQAAGYWLGFGLLALLSYSLVNWLFRRSQELGESPSILPGLMAAAFILIVAAVYWFLIRQRQLQEAYGLQSGWRELFHAESLFGFIPSVIWWFALTWVAYSVAGEKMPWISAHFVLPMALLGGWYFNETLSGVDGRQLFSRRTLLAIGLSLLLIIAVLVAIGPLLLGQITLGNQQIDNLSGLGRLIGGLVVVGILVYFWRQYYPQLSTNVRRVVWPLAVFVLLSLLTIRFSYMANFPNADYTTEFLVYAHGAPATKKVVLAQLEELSMRLHGDKSIRVAYDSDVSWPYSWYLREYPNRVFFGDAPTQSLNDSPVVIVGRKNWDNVDPYLSRNYEYRTYTFLWWPMEEYRKFSWDALVGVPDSPTPRPGILNPGVRQALWDIFFHRDYQRYGEVFGGTYTAGQWPLRHDLRLYIRRDVLASLWDHGLDAFTTGALVDPYEGNEMVLAPELVLNEGSVAGVAEGVFTSPRNVEVGPDGRLYVADSGNHRIQVFDADGQFVDAWGTFGAGSEQLNEPWGLAVGEEFVYVADTWNHRIQKYTLDGELVSSFGSSGSPSGNEADGGLGLFFGPRDVLLLDDGNLLVTDTGNHRLQLLDSNGQFLRVVGSFGNGLGQFNEPVGLAQGPDGTVYVADTWNGRIQSLTPDLIPIGEWRVDAWDGQSINNKPYLAVDSGGRVYTTDPEGYRVLVFSASGGYLNRFGQFGTLPNNFGLPNGITTDADDNLYIADAVNNRVVVYPSIYE